MSSFLEASGGQRAGRIVGLVVLGLWLAVAGVAVYLMSALGLGSCSSDDACAERAALSFTLTPAIHLLALVVGAWVALRRGTVVARTLILVALALAAPVLSFGLAIWLIAG